MNAEGQVVPEFRRVVVCFNCDAHGHRWRQCAKPLTEFCMRCGKKGVRIPSCPNCSENYLARARRKVELAPIVNSKQQCKWVHCTFQAMYKYQLDALIVPSITKIRPPHKYKHVEMWKHICNLELADPEHTQTGTIDLLIGAETYAEIIMVGQRTAGRAYSAENKAWVDFEWIDRATANS